MRFKYLLSVGLVATAASAFGWGQKGHDTTAYIAEKHLTPAAKAAVEELFDGKSIVYYSNWMDNASHTPEYAHTKTWHYKNIDAGVKYEDAPNIPSGNVVTGINDMVRVLLDENASREDKQLALKIVVHLLGDIHQPMHVGHATDLGGNKVKVKNFGKETNLHSLWDSTVPEGAHKWTYTEWQEQIDRLPEAQVRMVQKGNADDWCKETFEICKKVYRDTPEGCNISYDYLADCAPIVEAQFLRGGLRLADILNSIYDPNYLPNNSIVKK